MGISRTTARRYEYASCTCPPDIDDPDFKVCEKCKYEAWCDDEGDRMRDKELEKD